jgi:hypothetical protein
MTLLWESAGYNWQQQNTSSLAVAISPATTAEAATTRLIIIMLPIKP